MRAPVVSGAHTHVAQMENVAMRNLDLSPFFRSTVGFDRFFDLVEDSARWTGEDNYPPYNIIRAGEDQYAITLAVAGFAPEELTIVAAQNVLTVEGRKAVKDDQQFLYQGISGRHFKRSFSLADFVQVKGASIENGLLKIELQREVPEAMKPRRITINGATGSNDNAKIAHQKVA
jgi:molecular chaperone IbpA